ncbi:DJ-1/PfpI family protein [Rhodobacteraceae bacterium NNCM2]|nr:DJ-1/PfpI family protein [Coraliihabitans acroporae]
MRTVATLIFPQFELLDVYGPLEMFGSFPDEFRLLMVAEDAGPIPSTQGPRTVVDALIGEMAEADILLIPGGRGTRREVDNPALTDWIAAAADKAELVTSVCTGSLLLARAGLLDGRKATTNKIAFALGAEHGPNVDWQAEARWVEDGKFVTSSGVSAGIDMSLAVIARLLGPEAADEAARRAEYLPNKDPGNDPFAAMTKEPT